MKFQCNTKPLSDALNLGIINSNVSNFHKKSCIVQLTANKNILKINIEAAMICTEIQIKGSGDSEISSTVFVDSVLLKQLVSTLDSSIVTLDISDAGLVIQSGKSNFTLAKMIDSGELELKSPIVPDYTSFETDIDSSDWKFIKDNQMYAISLAFIHPVYTRVWIGESGDVLVGDFDASLFTHSKKSKLGSTCLLSDTIVNLFNSLPDGSKLVKVDKQYLIKFKSDSFEYVTQFTPVYETDEGIGSYNSDIFLTMMQHPNNYASISTASITKLLSQASLLSSTLEDTIEFSTEDKYIVLKDANVNGQIECAQSNTSNYSITFKLEPLRKVISNYNDDMINISPFYQDDVAAGILVWNNELTTIIAGVE